MVADFSYRGIREESEQAYFPIFEGDDAGGNFYVRVRGTPEGAFQSIRTIVHNADPALPITYFRTLDEQVNRSLNTERMLATLSGGFGTLALLLSLVGLYGVMSFVVTQRTREIGIRLALGATQRLCDLAGAPRRPRDDCCGHGDRLALRRRAGTPGGVSVVRRETNRSARDRRRDTAADRGGPGRGAHPGLPCLHGEPDRRFAIRLGRMRTWRVRRDVRYSQRIGTVRDECSRFSENCAEYGRR